MKVQLLGTGAAAGWPHPFCRCRSCEDARARGCVRGQTAALVDDAVLLDCGPTVPHAAERLGASLVGVHTVLVTHDHADHCAGDPLLWRSWVDRPGPLRFLGPAAAVAEARRWVGPDTDLDLAVLRPFDAVDLDGYRVRALPAAHPAGPLDATGGLLYDLTAPDGSRLLYATDTGPLPAETVEALRGVALDVLLLEETFGDREHGSDSHLNLESFPLQLAALRRVGAVTPATRVVAVHLGHQNPPLPELSRRLDAWGAQVLPDGAVLQCGSPTPAGPRRPIRALLLGGARSGKSLAAERRLAAEPAVLYVATGGERPDDEEWAVRVAAHRARRPGGWTTEETGDVAGALRRAAVPVLIDCLPLWLTAVLDDAGAWDAREGWRAAVDTAVEELLVAWDRACVPVVAVSNEVGSGVVPPTPAGRLFRDELGRLNARLAARSDEVVLVVAGVPLPLTPPGAPLLAGGPTCPSPTS